MRILSQCYKVLVFTVLLSISFQSAWAQYSISGEFSVVENDTETYTMNGPNIASISWYINNGKGTIMSQSGNSVTIRWDEGGTDFIDAMVVDNDSEMYLVTSSFVQIAYTPPPVPYDPLVFSQNCGSTEIRMSGSPPSGIQWYWQGTNSSGTSTSNSSASYTVTSTGTYYLRAYRSSTNQWSAGSSSVTISSIVPQVGSSSISGASSRCQGGGTSDYNASANNATGYTWSIQPSSAGTINNNGTVSWNSEFTGNATVSVVSSNGYCSTSTTKTVTVTPLVGSVTISGGVDSRCQGSNTTDYNSSASNAASYG
ncbi:hypothetical protein, partial [Roseivirga thermotolerans]